MARLDEPKLRSITREDLERFPVWTWDESREYRQPVTDEPLTDEYSPYFIKAIFRAEGVIFDGYLTGDGSYYAFAIFVGDLVFHFNLNLPRDIDGTIQQIRKVLNSPGFNLFPLQYESTVRYEGEPPIVGTLSP